MNRLLPGLLLVASVASQSAEWTVISEVPILGVPIDVSLTADGSYLLTYRDFDENGYFLRGILVENGTVVTDSSVILEPRVPGGTFELLMPSEQDYASRRIPLGVLKLGESGDTLWTARLDSVPAFEGCGSQILPASTGGCWAAFGPEPGGDEWRVWRLSAAGRIEAAGSFHLQGGPVNSMHDMAETADGGLLLAGLTDGPGMKLYSVLVRLDGDCRERWRVLDDVRFHASGDLVQSSADGSVFLAGYTGLERSDGYFMPPERMDVFLFVYDPEGARIGRSILDLPGQNAPLLMTLLEGGEAVLLVSSFEENTSFPGVYSLVRCSPE